MATSDYQIRAILRSTSVPNNNTGVFTGTYGTWQDLSSDRSWGMNVSGSDDLGNYVRNIDFEIRNKNTLEIVSSTSGDFVIQVDSTNAAIGPAASVITPLVGDGASVSCSSSISASCTSSITFNTNGVIYGSAVVNSGIPSGSNTFQQDWYNGSLDTSLYQIRATQTAGSGLSGTVNTWLDMNINRTWSVTASSTSGLVVKSSNITFEIREKASQTVVATTSGTFSLQSTAQYTGGGGGGGFDPE